MNILSRNDCTSAEWGWHPWSVTLAFTVKIDVCVNCKMDFGEHVGIKKCFCVSKELSFIHFLFIVLRME